MRNGAWSLILLSGMCIGVPGQPQTATAGTGGEAACHIRGQLGVRRYGQRQPPRPGGQFLGQAARRQLLLPADLIVAAHLLATS
jgi:hypothetical protein